MGVLGSGQLGRMFAIAARRMGYRVHTYSSKTGTPTGQVADVETSGSFDDVDALLRFARGVDVITFEFENVQSVPLLALADVVPVRPDSSVLHITQHRLREKNYLASKGFPVAPFRHVRSLAELREKSLIIGYPSVLKTAGFGYDGKGQARINCEADLPAAYAALNGAEGVLEGWVNFEVEVSVVAARGMDGSFVDYGVVKNQHSQGILDVTTAPAVLPSAVAGQAVSMTRDVLDNLGVVGVMCVEFFLTPAHQLIINELAPRPHNSGHWSFDACVTSQFEQQLRAVCNLPLGSTRALCPAAMANLLGDLWEKGEPDWKRAAGFADVKLHLYGKSEAVAGRKMGHLTALGSSVEGAEATVRAARAALAGPPGP